MPMTIDGVLRWWGREKPDQIAYSQSGDGVTYSDLDAWVRRVAARYVDLDVAAGDRVCIYAANCLEWCVAALAALRVGGVITGINAKMVSAEVAYLLGDYAPAVLVADSECGERLAEIGGLTSRTGAPVAAPFRMSIEDVAVLRDGPPAEDIVREVDPDACCMIVTTSGSTARPKGVMYSNHSLIDHITAFTLEDHLDVPVPKMLIVGPFSTSAGGMVFIHSLLQGGTGYLDNKFDPEKALELIVRERITTFCCAPIFLQRIAERPEFAEADVSCIKISQTGGAAVPMSLLKTWADKGVLVRQMYSQTEAGGWGVCNPRRYALSHPDRCGWGGPTRDIRIIDEHGAVLPPGQVGQIIMRGPGQMLGYWNDPEATAKTLVDGWLHTGDLGVLDELGLLKFVDRMKDIIISGGLNISAAEIERVIMDVGGVEEVAVIAAPDDRFGETPFAVVYGEAPPSVAAVVDHCNASLSSHKVPRYVVISGEPLPRLATGKISKPALRLVHLAPGTLPDRVR